MNCMNGAASSQSSMRREIASAYVATGARIGSWVIVAAVVMRLGTAEFALLALVRGTLSILNAGTLGLGPAMIHSLSRRAPGDLPVVALPVLPQEPLSALPAPAATIAYANPSELADPLREALRPLRTTYAAGLRIALLAGVVSAALLYAYASNFHRIHHAPYWLRQADLQVFILMMGMGAIFRLISDAPGAVLQVRDAIARDNLYMAVAETIWVVGVAWSFPRWPSMFDIGLWFLISGVALFVARLMSAASITQQFIFDLPKPPPGMSRALLAAGGVIVLGQFANYLYAPAAMILINRLLEPDLVAYYEPAVQIDGALLLLVSSFAAVLLPKAAVAHAAEDHAALRRYYERGTLATLALLASAAVAVYAASPWIFPLWLGREMHVTRAILPLLLLSTVIGGSGMVGRSILLGMGKAKAFTAAALTAGVANVVLAAVFLNLGFGLYGIVAATAVAVLARAGIWLPWYVLRTLRRAEMER